MKYTHLFRMAGLVLLAACSDAANPAGLDPSSGATARGGNAGISVMTRNVYIGFDGDAAIAALATGDPAIFGPVLQASIATLQATDFETRARAFAEEIAQARPHVVGLQEVYRIHADLSALGIPAVIDLDYLALLMDALNARGLHYRVVAEVVDTDIQPLPGISLADREVLLVDATRVRVEAGVVAQTFQANVGPLAPGIDKKAGYIVAPVTVNGRTVMVATTHLESDLGPGTHDAIAQLRAAQASEIAAVVAASPQAIIMGDLNDWADSPMYQVLQGAGLVDAWQALNPREAGNTGSCIGPDLSGPAMLCTERIDFVFERGLEQAHAGLLGSMARVGVDPRDRVQGPAGALWPSDHAGLVADFVVPQSVRP